MSKRIKIYTTEDLALHNSATSCWVSRNGKVYDITTFLPDHPGGDDIVLKFAGGDVDAIMRDKQQHEHSDSAYDVLDEYLIGRIGQGENIVDEGVFAMFTRVFWATSDFNLQTGRPQMISILKTLTKRRISSATSSWISTSLSFLSFGEQISGVWSTLRSGVFILMGHVSTASLTISSKCTSRDICRGLLSCSVQHTSRLVTVRKHWKMLMLIVMPCHKIFTVTQWWVIPLVWVPITTYLFLRAVLQFSGVQLLPFLTQPALPLSLLKIVPQSAYIKTGVCFIIGNIIWTMLEYGMHRFLFHIDEKLPDKPVFLLLHFLTHGVHHYLPMDRQVQSLIFSHSEFNYGKCSG